MSAGLFHHSVAGVNENDDQVGVAGARDHIAGILDMARRVGDDEFSPGSRKIFIGYVDGDSLLPLGTQSVGEESEIDLTVFLVAALPFEGFQLIGQYAFAVV